MPDRSTLKQAWEFVNTYDALFRHLSRAARVQEEREKLKQWSAEATAQSDFTLKVLKSQLVIEKRLDLVLIEAGVPEYLIRAGEDALTFQQKSEAFLSLHPQHSSMRNEFKALRYLRNNIAHDFWSSSSDCAADAFGKAFQAKTKKLHVAWRTFATEDPDAALIALFTVLEMLLEGRLDGTDAEGSAP